MEGSKVKPCVLCYLQTKLDTKANMNVILKFPGTLEVLDLSYNKFEGIIPSEVGKLADARISLNGNERM